ncbi:hypothetical protein Pla22_03980 [Rubripirellula amarantea]|uniref:Uncharacterized protein n=1 Tax=Rubripirellula amarantea TaxID=2527999 RepID=A0A5C5WSK1_9BACT|nr:hypothetical protein Pla22_03980 [Rubripirellula amarantea]
MISSLQSASHGVPLGWIVLVVTLIACDGDVQLECGGQQLINGCRILKQFPCVVHAAHRHHQIGLRHDPTRLGHDEALVASSKIELIQGRLQVHAKEVHRQVVLVPRKESPMRKLLEDASTPQPP